MATDSYVYRGTSCLRNRLAIRDLDALARLEANQTAIILAQLERERLVGRHDLVHLRAFHRRIFGDIYARAGELAPSPSPMTRACSRCPSTSSRIYRASSPSWSESSTCVGSRATNSWIESPTTTPS